jgi:hypothetical protein
MKQYAEIVSKFFSEKITDKAAESLEWFAVVLFHAATIPTMLAGLAGITDNMPPVDMVIFIWTGLLIYFVRSALLKKYLIMITIAVGFFAHSILMALMFFR